MTFYERTDALIESVIEILQKKFNRLKGLLSVQDTDIGAQVTDLYKEFDELVRDTLYGLAVQVYVDHDENGTGSELERWTKAPLKEEWLDEILEDYDPVSKYVYVNEIDRRRARLFEAIMGSTTPADEVDAALKSASLMYTIYAVRVTDEAAVRAMKDSGATRVRWVAEDDIHTCRVCHKRDNNIYPIDEVPPKPHVNCRCWLVRYP